MGDLSHTDFIAEDQYVFCYAFDPEADKPIPELLMALKAVGESRNRKVRDRCFTVWGGDFAPYYWIAVPGNLSAEVTDLLYARLGKARGYTTFDHGMTGRMGIRPIFRYDHGAVATYAAEDEGGTSCVDDGSGLTIHCRVQMPAFLMGEERYGPVAPADPAKKPKAKR